MPQTRDNFKAGLFVIFGIVLAIVAVQPTNRQTQHAAKHAARPSVCFFNINGPLTRFGLFVVFCAG